MFTFHVDTQAVKALELFAGNKDVRYYLNGIWVCAIDARTVRLTGCDGHTLAEHRITTETEMEGPFPRDGIIPRDAFKGLKGSVSVTVKPLSADMKTPGTYSINDAERAGKLVDGKYPDIDRVWPKSVNLEAGHYSNEYIGRVGQAAKLLGQRFGGTILQNGLEGSAVFRVRDDFVGLIMPMRRDDTVMPEWCATKIQVDQQKEAAGDLYEALLALQGCIAAGVSAAPDDKVMDNARRALVKAGATLRARSERLNFEAALSMSETHYNAEIPS